MESHFSQTQPLRIATGDGRPTIAVQSAGAEEIVVLIDGQLKYDTVDGVKREIEAVLAQASTARLSLDCSKVDFVDSQALAMLIALSRRCRQADGELALRNPRPAVQKLLQMTRMDSLFTILQTEPADAPASQQARVPLRPFVVPPAAQ